MVWFELGSKSVGNVSHSVPHCVRFGEKAVYGRFTEVLMIELMLMVVLVLSDFFVSLLLAESGFGTQAIGQIPSHLTYVTVLERTREFLSKVDESNSYWKSAFTPYKYLISGGAASLSSQLFFIPVDVVLQRVQTADLVAKQYQSNSPATSPNALRVMTSILRTDGLRGFYVGLWPSLMTNIPSSAIWWATYGVAAPFIDRILPPVQTRRPDSVQSDSFLRRFWAEQLKMPPLPAIWSGRDDVLVPVFAGMSAGTTAVCATNGLDVIKTRMQVLGRLLQPTGTTAGPIAVPSATAVARQLWLDEGWRAFTRGIAARLAQSLPQSALLSLSYHFLKRSSVRNE
jgi:hypothetical protein